MIVGTQDKAIARHQLNEALGASFHLEAYVWLSWGKPIVPQIDRALATIAGYPILTLWLDVEEDSQGVYMCNTIRRAVEACVNRSVGIYTSRYKWGAITGNTRLFAHLPLWYAHYDGREDFDDWGAQQFGGWTEPVMKQYTNTTTLAGVSCDLNVYRR